MSDRGWFERRELVGPRLVLSPLTEDDAQGFLDALGGPEEAAALVPALVTGDDQALPDEVTDDFRTAGLTHLTAVSGTNLTLLLASLLMVARWSGVRGRWRTCRSPRSSSRHNSCAAWRTSACW